MEWSKRSVGRPGCIQDKGKKLQFRKERCHHQSALQIMEDGCYHRPPGMWKGEASLLILSGTKTPETLESKSLEDLECKTLEALENNTPEILESETHTGDSGRQDPRDSEEQNP